MKGLAFFLAYSILGAVFPIGLPGNTCSEKNIPCRDGLSCINGFCGRVSTNGNCDLSNGILCPQKFNCIIPIGSTKYYCIRQGLDLGKPCSSDCRGQGCFLPEIPLGKPDIIDYCRGDLYCIRGVCGITSKNNCDESNGLFCEKGYECIKPPNASGNWCVTSGLGLGNSCSAAAPCRGDLVCELNQNGDKCVLGTLINHHTL